MKNKIQGISLQINTPLHWSEIFIYRKPFGSMEFRSYKVKDLTRYQRAVRLLNMFVERNLS
jgi:hypothetical protein